MLIVGSHTFESEHDGLFEGADILVTLTEHRFLLTLGLVVSFLTAPCYLVVCRERDASLSCLCEQLLLDSDAVVDFGEQRIVVEVGIGDRSKERINEEVVDLDIVVGTIF